MGLRGDTILRNLNEENPSFASPRNLAPVGAILPFLLGAIGAALVSEATPHRPWTSTPLSIFCVCLCPTALVSACVPRVFNWDWRAKYFGFNTIYFSSTSLLGLIPWLCLLLYGSLAVWEKLAVLVLYLIPIIWWCHRFITYYQAIYSDKDLRGILYIKELDVVYYCQKNDNWLIEKKHKFKIFPPNLFFITPLILAFLLAPWMRAVKSHFGLPFPYVFLTLSSLPLVMMVLGLTIKGYLTFYHYPRRIKSDTGKDVYVDMVSKTVPRKNM
jgi:hypothetical protein